MSTQGPKEDTNFCTVFECGAKLALEAVTLCFYFFFIFSEGRTHLTAELKGDGEAALECKSCFDFPAGTACL